MTAHEPTPLRSLTDVEELRFKNFVDHRGSLVPIECGKDVPFEIRRAFYIRPAEAGLTRGQHGHYKCTQVLICVSGSCRVIVQDEKERKEFSLDRHDRGLVIPPTIWAEEVYETKDTVLLVLCDQPFDASDYIDDYDVFVSFRLRGKTGTGAR